MDGGVVVEGSLAGMQAFELEDDHLLAERVSLAIRRHLESFERDLARSGDLYEVRIGGRQSSLARTPISADDPVDDRVSGCKSERSQRQLRARVPHAIALSHDVERNRAL